MSEFLACSAITLGETYGSASLEIGGLLTLKIGSLFLNEKNAPRPVRHSRDEAALLKTLNE